jgi:Tfp pilus assembly protein PilF
MTPRFARLVIPAAACALLALLAVPAAAAAEPLPELIERTAPGICTIMAYNPDVVMPTVGTGFFLAADRVVNARHVLGRADRAVVRTRDGASVAVAGILAEERNSDLVLLQLRAPVDSATVLRVADDAPAVGERLFTIGSPLGLEFTASDGIVSAYRKVPGAGVSMQHTVPVSAGSSGCPILNDRGRVVAVQTGVITAGQRIVHAGQALNFAVSAKLLAALQAEELRTLPQAREDVPPNWKPAITRGIDAISLHALTREDFRASLALFQAAAAEEPDEPDAWFRVALCHEKLGEREAAIANYRKAIALKPDFAVALNNLGSVFIAQRDFARAAETLAAAIAARADYAAAYGNLAVACLGAENWEGARDAARAAVRLNANDAEARLNLGIALVRLGDRAGAGQQYQALLKGDRPRAARLKKLLDEPATNPATNPAAKPPAIPTTAPRKSGG